MEVEFLIPNRSRGTDRAIAVDDLKVSAQPLRFVSLAYDHSIVLPFYGHNIRVPEPEAFILLKLLVIPRRRTDAKKERILRRRHHWAAILLHERPPQDELEKSTVRSRSRGESQFALRLIFTCRASRGYFRSPWTERETLPRARTGRATFSLGGIPLSEAVMIRQRC